jgi:hypothetical protein
MAMLDRTRKRPRDLRRDLKLLINDFGPDPALADVDAEQVQEIRMFIKARRRAGHPQRSYNIDSPYERRPLSGPESR